MISPYAQMVLVTQQVWLKMMESMRKDIECTFGILKVQFHILKTGIQVHSLKMANQIWKTCCSLHNWLLEMDGLDERFELDGTTSEWEDPLGLNDIDDFQNLSPAAKWGHVGNEAHAIHHYDESRLGQDLPREMVLAEDVFEDDSSKFDYDITILIVKAQQTHYQVMIMGMCALYANWTLSSFNQSWLSTLTYCTKNTGLYGQNALTLHSKSYTNKNHTPTIEYCY